MDQSGTPPSTSSRSGPRHDAECVDSRPQPVRTRRQPLARPGAPLCQIHEGVDVEHHHNQIYGAANDCGPTLDPDAADLRIEALRDNGGLVETVSVLQGSPILDAGNPLPPLANDPTRCQTNDARYFPRPRDGDGDGEAICDVGAWESQREAPLFRDDFQPVLWRPEPAAAAF
ncbi:choice-of-anchor Q domain-containing protein [Pseudofulvimonas gallinarii]|uniref:choice-of-anchor Q domain-containing protein n=1 Tax=Pseudofulvimonas gallinarii TaxID=634155 RepID=UPI003CCCBD6D